MSDTHTEPSLDPDDPSEAQLDQLLQAAQAALSDESGYDDVLASKDGAAKLYIGAYSWSPTPWEDYTDEIVNALARTALDMLGRAELAGQLRTRVNFDDRGVFFDVHVTIAGRGVSDFDLGSFDNERDLAHYVLGQVGDVVKLSRLL